MNKYQEGKAKAIEKAQDFQKSFADGVAYSWGELFVIQSSIEKDAKRYGLLKEFRENSIL